MTTGPIEVKSESDRVANRTHELKVWPEFMSALLDCRKMFEVRKNDRDYQVGDTLILRRFDPATGEYPGGICRREVSYVLAGGQFGIDPEYVVLGLRLPS